MIDIKDQILYIDVSSNKNVFRQNLVLNECYLIITHYFIFIIPIILSFVL